MLHVKDHRALDKFFLFVASLLDRRRKHKNLTPVTSVQTRYSEILADVTSDMGHRARSGGELDSLKIRLKNFKRMLVETLDEHYDTGLGTLKLHLYDHMVEVIQRSGTVPALEISAYEYFIMDDK